MSSAALAVTLTQTIPLWIGVKKRSLDREGA